ncbi:PD40 domain-containing protein [Microbacteriaceae bacterium VKM Ac-2854]|nr:PD40 domain-containing protein [Microbacteriaceae bacterium VKM Ac-2854]
MFRTLSPGQSSRILLAGPADATVTVLFESGEVLFEAPNWSADGASLYVNGDGGLWRVDLTDPTPVRVEFDGLPPINNDHVLDPDGEHIFLSANDGHIYRGALTGGAVTRVTPDDGRWHFLHGVSPDGQRLAYVDLGDFTDAGRLMVLPASGGEPEHVDTGEGHIDGPEWSPDGAWLLYNTESFTEAPGHAQLARIADGGGSPERLVQSDTVDWFPHTSPDGRWASYISFPPGTQGHPADLDVVVHVVATDDWTFSVQRHPLFGGQGTINVNSWSPDSSRFAFVDYPIAH